VSAIEQIYSSAERLRPAISTPIWPDTNPEGIEMVSAPDGAPWAFQPPRARRCQVEVYGGAPRVVIDAAYQTRATTYTQTICTEYRWTLEYLLAERRITEFDIQALEAQYRIRIELDRPPEIAMRLDGIDTWFRF
jgi:hypothetical protein